MHPGPRARVLLSPRWLLRHVLLVAALATCWTFGRWQLRRALDRDSVLNWSYAIEWALFAAFAVLCWGWFLRDELRGRPEPPQQRPAYRAAPPPPVTDDEDPELAAYNRYLAQLDAKDQG